MPLNSGYNVNKGSGSGSSNGDGGGTDFTPSKTNLYAAVKAIFHPATNAGVDADDANAELDVTATGMGSASSFSELTGMLADSQVGARTIGAGKLVANSVTKDEIGDDAVGTDEIADAAVTQAKLAPGVGGSPGFRAHTPLTAPADVTADVSIPRSGTNPAIYTLLDAHEFPGPISSALDFFTEWEGSLILEMQNACRANIVLRTTHAFGTGFAKSLIHERTYSTDAGSGVRVAVSLGVFDSVSQVPVGTFRGITITEADLALPSKITYQVEIQSFQRKGTNRNNNTLKYLSFDNIDTIAYQIGTGNMGGADAAARTSAAAASTAAAAAQTDADAALVGVNANADTIDRLTHLTRDLHIAKVVTQWTDVDDSAADVFWTVPVNNAITLTDANFNNAGASITIPASTSERTTYVFVRLTAGTDISDLRMFSPRVEGLAPSQGFAPSNVWGRAEDEGVTIPAGNTYDYYMAVINLNETTEETWKLQQRNQIDVTQYTGEGSIPAGGANNQILAKGSAADYDVEWVAAPSGGDGSATVDAESILDAVKASRDEDDRGKVIGTGDSVTEGGEDQLQFYDVVGKDFLGSTGTEGFADPGDLGVGAYRALELFLNPADRNREILHQRGYHALAYKEGGGARELATDAQKRLAAISTPSRVTRTWRDATQADQYNHWGVYFSADTTFTEPTETAPTYRPYHEQFYSEARVGTTGATVTLYVSVPKGLSSDDVRVRFAQDFETAAGADVLYPSGAQTWVAVDADDFWGSDADERQTNLAAQLAPGADYYKLSARVTYASGTPDGFILEIADRAYTYTSGGSADSTARVAAAAAQADADSNTGDIDDLRHLTRDLHSPAPLNNWLDASDSDGDMYQALGSSTDALTDANFNNEGASLTVASNASTQVYVRLPIGVDHTDYRIVFGTGFNRSREGNLWTVPSYPAAASTTYQYWRADGFVNGANTSIKLQKREASLNNTFFSGRLEGAALDQIDDLQHLTRDLHTLVEPPTWEDAADADGDVYQVIDPGTAITLTDANFNNNGATIELPHDQNAKTIVFVRLPAATDHTDFRITFDDRLPTTGNTWREKTGPTATFKYYRVTEVDNYGNSIVQLEKKSASIDGTRYDGSLGGAALGQLPPTVLAGTREPTPNDGKDGDFWVAGLDNGGTLSISENVFGSWVELGRASEGGGNGGGSSGGSTSPETLYEDENAHTYDHDGFRTITLSRAPAAGTVLQFNLKSEPRALMANTIYMSSDAFLALDVPDTGATGYNANWPSPGNKCWVGVAPAAVDTTARITYTVGGNEWSHLTFLFIRRRSNTSMDVLYTFDGVDRSASLKIEEMPNGSAGSEDGGDGADTTARSAAAAAQATADAALSRTGGTMTGKITLDGAPTVDLHAATKKYVDDNTGSGGSGGSYQGAFADSPASVDFDANVHADLTLVSWNTPSVDEGGWFDSSNPTRYTVPSGIDYVNVSFGISRGYLDTAYLQKNGTTIGQASSTRDDNSITVVGVPVDAGDYFEAGVWNNRANANVSGVSFSNFSISAASGVGVGGSAEAGDGSFLEEIGASATLSLTADTVADTGLDMPASVATGEVWAVKVGNERYDDLAFFFPSEIIAGDGAEIGDTLDPNTNAGDSAGVTIRAKRGNSTQNDTILLAQDSTGNIVISSSHSNLDPSITLYRVNAVGGGGGAQLKDLDNLPAVASHEEGDLVAVDDLWYKLATTDETTANLFGGDVGRDVFNTTAGERWRGISNSQSPNGFSTDGEFTANPNNTLSLLLASSSRHIRVAMKRDVYESAKGSTFSPSDHIAIKVTMADGTTTDEAVLAYYNAYERTDRYIIWQHRHASDNYNLYDEAAGNAVTIEFFTTSGSTPAATTTPLFTHEAALKHWIHWPTGEDPAEDGRNALALAQANAARLDALDMHVDGISEPIHSQTYDDNTALLAPLAGNAGNFAISQAFTDILPDDLLVVDWKKCEHLNHHDEYVVPGSDTDSGRMYLSPRNFDNTEWNGEFVYALDRAIQDNGAADTLNSWIVGSILFSGSTLTFGLHLQQGGTRTNRNLKPQAGFSLTLRIYRNSAQAVPTSAPFKGIELGRLIGHDSNHLGEQPWTSLATGVTTADGPGTGYSHWLSIPMHSYLTLDAGLGIILEMKRTGVTTQFSQVFIPWHAIGNWDSRATSYPMWGGSWKASGTSNNDRIEVRGRINAGRIELQAACGGADDEGTLHAYIAT